VVSCCVLIELYLRRTLVRSVLYSTFLNHNSDSYRSSEHNGAQRGGCCIMAVVVLIQSSDLATTCLHGLTVPV